MTPWRGLVLALLVLLLVPAGALAQEKQEVAKHPSPGGDVSAELTFTKVSDFEYTNVRLKITRGGAVLHDARVPAPCEECPTNPAGGGEPDIPSLRLRDLDGDGEPEALVDLYTGGAHCCTYTQIYGYHAATNAYRRFKAGWGDVGYELVDLDGDGPPEFRSADPRFAGAFTAYVASGFPIQLWRWTSGRLTDVTRNYRSLIKANLRGYLKLYREVRRDRDGDVRGFLAAYVADKYLLGQGDTAFDLVYAAYRRGELNPPFGSLRGKRYISALRRYLRRWGYR